MMNCTRLASPTSAAIIGSNDDLLMEILLFSPAKSLVRFKSVSKHWQSLISAPSFNHLNTLRHRHRPKPQPVILLHYTSSQFLYCNLSVKKLIPFSFEFSYTHMIIMQSCNGLLLLECRNSRYGKESYFICNPITMQYRNLMIRRPFCGLCLAFDPMKSPHYKVIRFVSKGEERLTPFAIDVYESETHKWKHLGQHDIDIMYYWQIHDGVYWNGRMYFIRPGGGNSFCFDVEKLPNYVVQWIDKPPRVCSRNATIKNYAMESNGHLHSMTISLRPDKKCLSIFELNKDDLSWFMKYRVDLNPIADMLASCRYDLFHKFLGIVRGERDEDTMLLFHDRGKTLLYSFYDKCFEVLVDFRTEDYCKEAWFDFNDSNQFIETLAPV